MLTQFSDAEVSTDSGNDLLLHSRYVTEQVSLVGKLIVKFEETESASIMDAMMVKQTLMLPT